VIAGDILGKLGVPFDAGEKEDETTDFAEKRREEETTDYTDYTEKRRSFNKSSLQSAKSAKSVVQFLLSKKGMLRPASPDNNDADRCLRCDQVCEICCDVCPNRANMAFTVQGFAQPRQIVHFDRMCNECGNCAIFCPHSGKPYTDKFTVFSSAEDFSNSENCGVLFNADGSLKLRLEDKTVLECGRDDARIPDNYRRMIAAVEAYR
jgi:putative selenate reductase